MDAACRVQLEDAEELKLRALIDEEYTSHPFYGSRRMVVFLQNGGHVKEQPDLVSLINRIP